MALTATPTLERKDNSDWTREQKLIQAVLYTQKTGASLSRQDLDDLLLILIAVDDYSKGTNTAMDLIKTHYQTWQSAKNVRP